MADEVSNWVDVMQKGGGWAMFILSCAVIIKLWSELKATNAKLFGALDQTNEILKLLRPKLPPADRS